MKHWRGLAIETGHASGPTELGPGPWRLGHRPSLDALRGIAVLLVLAGHFEVVDVSAATVGVSLFFALSGYLITGLLVGELSDTGQIRLQAFYGRRARRLLPALVVLLTSLATFAAIRGELGAWMLSALPVALYIGNWGYLAETIPHELGHTWSLAIEEQFYIVWPIALLLAKRSLRLALIVAVFAIAISFAATVPFFPTMGIDYYGSPQRAKDLLCGCLVALLSARRGRDLSPSRPLFIVSVVLLAGVSAGLGPFSPMLTPIPCAVIVAWCAARPRMAWPPLSGTGRISYGLYLYHYPLIGLAAWPVLIISTFALALASWYGVERHFLGARGIGGARALAQMTTVPAPAANSPASAAAVRSQPRPVD